MTFQGIKDTDNEKSQEKITAASPHQAGFLRAGYAARDAGL
jgi:hypothetical protein